MLLAMAILSFVGYANWHGAFAWAAQGEGRKVAFYQDSMHPWIKSAQPGKCTICGMDLTPIREGEKGFSSGGDVVVLSSNSITVLNVQTEEVKRRPLSRTSRVAGTLEANETTKTIVAAPVACRIQALAVQYVGVEVTAGQKLVTLFTPELVQRRAYLSALGVDYSGPTNYMAQSGGRIDPYSSDLLAPQAGTVIERDVYPGQYVEEGQKLLTIADPSVLWFRFDVYEQQLPWFEPGQTIDVTARAVPGKTFPAVITFIEPTLSDATRAVKVRADIRNPVVSTNGSPHRLLRFGMYAEGRVRAAIPNVLAVPRTAILFPGGSAYAYLDRGDGAYERRRVKLGRQGDQLWEVLGGLEEGDRVVTVGNVLIDAQAQFSQGGKTDAAEAECSETAEPAGDASGAEGMAAAAGPAAADACCAEAKASTEPPTAPMPAGVPAQASPVASAPARDGTPAPGASAVARANTRFARLGVRDEMRQMRITTISEANRAGHTNAPPVIERPPPAVPAPAPNSLPPPPLSPAMASQATGPAGGAATIPEQAFRDADKARAAWRDEMWKTRMGAMMEAGASNAPAVTPQTGVKP